MSKKLSLISICHEIANDKNLNPHFQLANLSGQYVNLFSSLLSRFFVEKKKVLKIIFVNSNKKKSDNLFNYLVKNNIVNTNVTQLSCSNKLGQNRFKIQNTVNTDRISSLIALLDINKRIVVTDVAALCQNTVEHDLCVNSKIEIDKNSEIDIDDFKNNLINLGYDYVNFVDSPATFAIRGQIFDVFPSHQKNPVRCVFVGDKITQMFGFNIETQRRKSEINSFCCYLAQEYHTFAKDRETQAQNLFDQLSKDKLDTKKIDRFLKYGSFSDIKNYIPIINHNQSTAIEYINKSNSLVVFVDAYAQCLTALDNFREELEKDIQADRENGYFSLNYSAYYNNLIFEDNVSNCENLIEVNQFNSNLNLERLNMSAFEPKLDHAISLSTNLEDIVKYIGKLGAENVYTVILCKNPKSVQQIAEIFAIREMKYIESELDKFVFNLGDSFINICTGFVEELLWLDENIVLMPESVFIKQNSSKAKSKKLSNFLTSLSSLQKNNIVVHLDHGLGRYLGLKVLQIGKLSKEFLELQYQDNDRIYVPIDRINTIQKYSTDTDNINVKIDKLKSKNWQTRKANAKKQIEDIADALLKAEAQRNISKALIYPPPSKDYYLFEEGFEYQETEGQIDAIADVTSDLTTNKTMDRLIVGDVGFGKTEVALRAIFQVVENNMQAVFLAPTTILSHQHFNVIKSRFKGFAFNIALLNRFTSSKQVKEILINLENGIIDIVVGTHKLLSNKIKFKNIGIIVIDEEQRFGVKHKEQIKKIKDNTNILTLTATPIPRTLHMSMLNLRDISLITTPPPNRKKIESFLIENDNNTIKTAIQRELNRSGQVFYVHNKVLNISKKVAELKESFPNETIKVIHGQMSKHELQKNIIDFIEGKFSILVCTTIIESGVDIANVNTIIINEADKFGLAQLYQLRGRVGRSNEQAYAYFIVRDLDKLNIDAQKRLNSIVVNQELGSGFNIASHDLEIRGTGNLLGSEQSGSVYAVGIEMYTKMLTKAISRIQGGVVYEESEPELVLNAVAKIPETVIENIDIRLDFYKKLFAVDAEQELLELIAEIYDRFGTECVHSLELTNLFKIARIKYYLKICRIKKLTQKTATSVEIEFYQFTKNTYKNISKIFTMNNKNYVLTETGKFFINTEPKAKKTNLFLEQLEQKLYKIVELFQ